MDEAGPGEITHFWTTMWADGQALKALVLRMYWDEEKTPSVESPLGDFFGLGLGDYVIYESAPLAVAPNRALNSFFPMPFQKHARITLTNEGAKEVPNFYFNIDYRAYARPLPSDLFYFHAQYRQASPNHGWSNQWKSNGDKIVEDKKNMNGEDNYVWMEASGRGHFAGVTMSVLQNQDGWWGEGDDMFFIDGEKVPSIIGTGSEDYFLGAFDFGDHPFSYAQFGAPLKGEERAGGRSSVYRFHLDSPLAFTKSLRATIEHGHANVRSDNYFSVAYWYQTEPHAAFPVLHRWNSDCRCCMRSADPETLRSSRRSLDRRRYPVQRQASFQMSIAPSCAWRSISFSSASVNSSFFTASSESSSCSTLRAPIRAVVTRWSRSTQAMAICASVCPRPRAISFNARTRLRFS